MSPCEHVCTDVALWNLSLSQFSGKLLIALHCISQHAVPIIILFLTEWLPIVALILMCLLSNDAPWFFVAVASAEWILHIHLSHFCPITIRWLYLVVEDISGPWFCTAHYLGGARPPVGSFSGSRLVPLLTCCYRCALNRLYGHLPEAPLFLCSIWAPLSTLESVTWNVIFLLPH